MEFLKLARAAFLRQKLDALAWIVRYISESGARSLALSCLLHAYKLPYQEQRLLQSLLLKKVLVSAQNTKSGRYKPEIDYLRKTPAEKRISALRTLPLLRREQIQTTGIQDFIDPFLVKQYGIPVETSGTTGKPLTLYQDKRSFFYKSLSNSVWFSLLGFIPFPSQEHLLHIGAFKAWNTSLGYRFDIFKILKDPARFAQWLERFCPEAVYGKVTDLFLLAEEMEKCRIDARFRFLFTDAETLFAQTKIWLEKKLGGNLYHKYASTEFGTIAVECPEREGGHVITDRLIVEVVDENSRVLPEMTPGLIVITALDNFVMPTLRYVTGDRGYLSSKECECGLRSPRLFVLGREKDYIETREKKVYANEYHDIISSVISNANIRHWQVKAGKKNLVVDLLPGKNFDGATLGGFRETLQGALNKKLAPASITVQLNIISQLELQPSGKAKVFQVLTNEQ